MSDEPRCETPDERLARYNAADQAQDDALRARLEGWGHAGESRGPTRQVTARDAALDALAALLAGCRSDPKKRPGWMGVAILAALDATGEDADDNEPALWVCPNCAVEVPVSGTSVDLLDYDEEWKP